MKVDDIEAVKFAVECIQNYQTPNIKSNYDNTIPVVAYKLSKLVGLRIKHTGIESLEALKEVLAPLYTAVIENNHLYVKVADTFSILVNNKLEPAVYIINSKPICDLQEFGRFGKYIDIDEDVVCTNFTLHSRTLFKTYMEFATKDIVTYEDIVTLFTTIYEVASKYVDSINNINEFTDHISASASPQNDASLTIDFSKYHIKQQTALTSGAWDE